MKEIGGYLELEKLINHPYHKHCICLSSGRSALRYLLDKKEIKTLYLPFFLCDSVYDYVKESIVNVKFYHIDENFHPIINSFEPDAYIYIVNYFGFLTNYALNIFKNKFKYIIIDNTHAFFLEPLKDTDTIYSCRKFFGVPDGAYLYSDIENNDNFECNKVTNKISHIIGRAEYSASEYYQEYIKSDHSFSIEPIKSMSNFTNTILGAINYSDIKIKRNINYNFLRIHLDQFNLLPQKLLDSISLGPFCYPLLVKNASLVRTKLISFKIYIPILWPDIITNRDSSKIEVDFAKNILPIPCDHRYDKSDMAIIINIIKNEKLI